MRSRSVLLLCSAALLLASAPAAVAAQTPGPEMVAVDALVVRPVGVAVTVVSAAVFVVALPFAAIAGKVPEAAEAMVAKPTRVMFCRELGDFEAMRNHSVRHDPPRQR